MFVLHLRPHAPTAHSTTTMSLSLHWMTFFSCNYRWNPSLVFSMCDSVEKNRKHIIDSTLSTNHWAQLTWCLLIKSRNLCLMSSIVLLGFSFRRKKSCSNMELCHDGMHQSNGELNCQFVFTCFVERKSINEIKCRRWGKKNCFRDCQSCWQTPYDYTEEEKKCFRRRWLVCSSRRYNITHTHNKQVVSSPPHQIECPLSMLPIAVKLKTLRTMLLGHQWLTVSYDMSLEMSKMHTRATPKRQNRIHSISFIHSYVRTMPLSMLRSVNFTEFLVAIRSRNAMRRQHRRHRPFVVCVCELVYLCVLVRVFERT